MKRFLGIKVLIVGLLMVTTGCSRNTIVHFPEYFKQMETNTRHQTTQWNVTSSMKFDALCFINTLTGEDFYLAYHQAEYDLFTVKMDDEVESALLRLRTFKEQIQMPLANLLVGFAFVMQEDQSLSDLIKTFEAPETMYKRYLQLAYTAQDAIDNSFEPIRQDVIVVLKYLEKRGFEDYWQQHIEPKVSQRIKEIQLKTADFNIVPVIEQYLGYGLFSEQINIYVMGFAQPTAFHFGYDNFITDEVWPADIIYIAAIHEPMHPGINMNDYDIAEAILKLKNDEFVAETFAQRDTKFGYNNVFLYIEENIIQSLDRQIALKMGVETRTLKDWITKDDGMHVVGMALYELMEQENFIAAKESIGEFLVRMHKKGKFNQGKIKQLYLDFVAKHN